MAGTQAETVKEPSLLLWLTHWLSYTIGPNCLGIARPTVGWALPTQSELRQSLIDTATGQSGLDYSSPEVSSSQVILGSIQVIIKTNQDKEEKGNTITPTPPHSLYT